MQRLSVGVRRVTVLTHIRAGGEWNAAPTINAHNEIFTVILLQCKFQPIMRPSVGTGETPRNKYVLCVTIFLILQTNTATTVGFFKLLQMCSNL